MIRAAKPWWIAVFTLAALARCHPSGDRPSPAPAPEGAASEDSITREALASATYDGIEEAGGPVTLAGGVWQGRPFVEGGASRPEVRLLADFEVRGDLDGDGRDEAVVLLGASAGGSGEFTYVAVVGRAGASPKCMDTAPLGDRVQIRGARVEGNHLVLDVVQAGSGDASCCPGDLLTRAWDLQAGSLVEAPSVRTGRLTPEAIAGTQWTLDRWSETELTPDDVEVTLRLENGRFMGSGGCNNYFSQVTPGEVPGAIVVGPPAGTRKACPEPAMGVEDRFLHRLAAVRSFRFVQGRLGLVYELDGESGTMLFRAQPGR